MSLRQAALRGAAWSIVERGSIQAIGFVVTIAMARRLTPADYGSVGVLLILIELGRTLIDGGLGQCLIRNQGGTPTDRNTVYIFNLSASLLLYMLLCIAAPWIADLYDDASLTHLLRLLGICLPLFALNMVPRSLMTARLDFRPQTRAGIIAGIASGLTGIGMAYAGCGVMSLVGYQIVLALTTAIAIQWQSDWSPSLKLLSQPHRHISRKSLAEMWRFGGGVVTASLIDGIYNNFIYGLITRQTGAAVLGAYTRARQIATLPANNLSDVIQKVSYPSLCQVKDDKDTMRRHFLKYVATSMWIAIPVLGIIAIFSKQIIYILLGNQWTMAAQILPYLCVSMMLLPLQSLNLNILLATGHSRRYLTLEIIKKIAGSAIMLWGISRGFQGICIAFPLISALSLIINSWYSRRLIGAGLLTQLAAIFRVNWH